MESYYKRYYSVYSPHVRHSCSARVSVSVKPRKAPLRLLSTKPMVQVMDGWMEDFMYPLCVSVCNHVLFALVVMQLSLQAALPRVFGSVHPRSHGHSVEDCRGVHGALPMRCAVGKLIIYPALPKTSGRQKVHRGSLATAPVDEVNAPFVIFASHCITQDVKVLLICTVWYRLWN